MMSEEKIFPEIVIYNKDGIEFCHRFHYIDGKINEMHADFMSDHGWVDTGECRFNSGNGTLHIYKKRDK